MRRLKIVVAVLGLIAIAANTAHPAFASPVSPKSGAEYTVLPSPQPVPATGKKIEVIEFFMYHCPACYAIEPELNAWVKAQGERIVFRRIHVPHTGDNDPEAHLFLTLEAMQREDALHGKVEATWHVERRRLGSDADNLDWAVKNGIDREQFLGVYNSFSVLAKLKSTGRLASNYRVEGTPTLIVDGRYLTTPTMVDASNPGIARPDLARATLQVVDVLVANAQQAHRAAPAK
ncbi:thiol:disulfide interchange protein DsbA/DsbL [Rugamonas sp.]|uniref:thiol:disulfide interchange protein DsbA/DsbL n=1 Tax=Rugamonas sp. TaxID=1926287 RepID=UPI0025EC32F7|nr:thiol:disulfide interchange protein DsbA/DsbL [Rugamonas sp.]